MIENTFVVHPHTGDHPSATTEGVEGASAGVSAAVSSARVPVSYRVTLDRLVLEQIYTAIQAPRDAEPVPTHVCLQPDALTLSTVWDGARFTSTMGLRRPRNNLPASGLTLSVSEALALVNRAEHLGRVSSVATVRRLDLVLEPALGRVTIASGGKTAVVTAAFETAPDYIHALRGIDVRLRSASYDLTPRGDPHDASTRSVGAQGGRNPTALVSCGIRWPASLLAPDFPLGALARVLAHPSDLLARPQPPNPRLLLDTSELHATLGPPATPGEDRAHEDQLNGACRVYFEIKWPVLFACLRASGGIPEHGVDVALSWHSAASEMLSLDLAPGSGLRAPGAPPAKRSRLPFVHLLSDTLRWLLATAEDSDRLLIGLRRGKAASVLLARGSGVPAFVTAPSTATADGLN
ncbi:hypothetical protein [Methylobacterium iners]|uniref:Uncharacterized protein n=1 Tax=Methylobacterium iners TaxID=418707 RepID=A0ABQ4S7F6_9HYPH|nr:hypothetical protein [Methylobacterium iners]GJD97692.1 hypothetical protein OCOJLMKI_4925 [Methylobacterium iners]